MNVNENKLLAKEDRFKQCHEALPIFYAFAPRAM